MAHCDTIRARAVKSSLEARMVKSADTADLKSADLNRSWGFKSPSGHQIKQAKSTRCRAKPLGSRGFFASPKRWYLFRCRFVPRLLSSNWQWSKTPRPSSPNTYGMVRRCQNRANRLYHPWKASFRIATGVFERVRYARATPCCEPTFLTREMPVVLTGFRKGHRKTVVEWHNCVVETWFLPCRGGLSYDRMYPTASWRNLQPRSGT